jgi:pyruvate/2-oxoglutarate dehydrogenase complex dihydrolipoamide dehydrogenase (E3) component
MTDDRVVVVGAGPSGLGCATALAGHLPVTLVDRIPVVGGESGWRSTQVRQAAHQARTRGVDMRLGSSALRWQGGRLLVAGPGRIEWLPATQLFYAGGLRPATPMDLRISGDRPAGVIAATVALHLLESRVPLWREVVVVGTSRWAREVSRLIRGYGGTVTGVSQDEVTIDGATRSITHAQRLRVTGRDRVESLSCTTSGEDLDIRCDAVILAGPPRPSRTIDGAITDPSADVVFVQPSQPVTVADRHDYGARAARTWLRSRGGNP